MNGGSISAPGDRICHDIWQFTFAAELGGERRVAARGYKNAQEIWRRAGDNPQTGRPIQGRVKILTVKQLGAPAARIPLRVSGVDRPSLYQLNTHCAAVDPIQKAWANAPETVVAKDMSDPLIPEVVRATDLEPRNGGAFGESLTLILQQITQARR